MTTIRRAGGAVMLMVVLMKLAGCLSTSCETLISDYQEENRERVIKQPYFGALPARCHGLYAEERGR